MKRNMCYYIHLHSKGLKRTGSEAQGGQTAAGQDSVGLGSWVFAFSIISKTSNPLITFPKTVFFPVRGMSGEGQALLGARARAHSS